MRPSHGVFDLALSSGHLFSLNVGGIKSDLFIRELIDDVRSKIAQIDQF
jgi:hypothetical protein